MNENCKAILKEPEDDFHNVRSFLHGACHVFAMALQRRFNKYVIIVLHIQEQGLHVYCQFQPDKSVDVVGIASESRANRELGWTGRKEEVLPGDLRKYKTLCFDPFFLEIMEQRAESRIERFKDFYDGARGTDNDIPGPGRIDRASSDFKKELFKKPIPPISAAY